MKKIFTLILCLFACTPLLLADDLKVGNYDESTPYDSSVNYNTPFLLDYHYSASQVIYPATEIEALKNKEITGITYKASNQTFCYTLKMSVEIYLYETEETEFPKNEKDEVVWFPQGKLVYNQSQEIDLSSHMYDDIEFSFQLDEPYRYEGKNLVVMMKTIIDDLDGENCLSASNGYLSFYCYWNKGHLNAYNYHSDTRPFYENSTPWCSYDYAVAKFQFQSIESGITQKNKNDLPTIKKYDRTIVVEHQSFLTIELFNEKGQLIREKRGSNLSFDNLQQGCYIMRICTSEGEIVNRKINIK